ncbi:MAG: pirin family protein [Flavobacteriales bacterium]|nr:pirin family protein [Flavobacteriales bacterium]
MSDLRTVEAVLAPLPPGMVGDGFRVHNFFPNGYRIGKRMSPFFLLDYNSLVEFTPSERPRGVGVHPHRGFETVTIAYQGEVAHHDSAGNSGVIRSGDVQWMTAGSGVLHKEYHSADFTRSGGPFQMVQLWVNLPAQFKMHPPRYQALAHADLGKAVLPDNGGAVNVVAGRYDDVAGPAKTFTPIELWDARLNAGGRMAFSLPATHSCGMLVVGGSVNVNGTAVPTDHFVVFAREGERFEVVAHEAAIVLVLAGEPIDEPIAQYGPFLMNTHEELQQAFKDLAAGKFGVLED